VATHPDARRQGLGRAVVEALLAKAASLDLAFVYLEVRPSNAAAIALYQSLGFTLVGRRKNFYRHPTEDALLMQVDPPRGTSPKKD
jgi:ribosomal-protein-alanine N-acetyltransferase